MAAHNIPLGVRTEVRLALLEEKYAIVRLGPDSELPAWAWKGSFCSVTRTRDELSLVCEQRVVPPGLQAERDRRLLRVAGPLDFSMTSVLSSLTVPLAENRISLFAISTFDTDYLLLAQNDLENGIAALEGAGHSIDRSKTA